MGFCLNPKVVTSAIKVNTAHLRGPQSLVTLVPLPGTDYDKWDTIISQEGLEVSKRLPVCWVLGLIRFYEHKQMEPKPPWMMFVLPGWVILMVVFD